MNVRLLALLVTLTLVTPACTSDRVRTNTPRTATEQLLLTESIREAIGAVELPEVAGRSITVSATSLAGDAEVGYVRTALEERARRAGATVVAEDSDLTLHAMIDTAGTDDRHMGLGIPEISSPAFAFPGIYVFDFRRQLGFTKLSLETRDADGNHVASSDQVLGSTHFNTYKWFVLFVYRSDDIYQDGYDWHFGVN